MVDFKAYFCVTGNIPAEKEKVMHWREGTLHEPSQLRPEKIHIKSTRVKKKAQGLFFGQVVMQGSRGARVGSQSANTALFSDLGTS